MPKLTDDARYAGALTSVLDMQDEETQTFRARLADRSIALVRDAMREMGDTFSEATVRRHLARMPEAYVEESMRYIRRVLVRSGEIELAKRLDEVDAHVGFDDLPEIFQAGYEEMQRGGLLGALTGPEPEEAVTQ